jgi:hypothetical protein
MPVGGGNPLGVTGQTRLVPAPLGLERLSMTAPVAPAVTQQAWAIDGVVLAAWI